jgi:uncharacterized RDD family membrane protein YckC
MYCTQCGSPLLDGAVVCPNCGWRRTTGDDIRAEVEARESRGLKLCIACRSEIPIDATVCHRCDALQPGAPGFGAPPLQPGQPAPRPALRPIPPRPADAPPRSGQSSVAAPALATIGQRIGAYVIDIMALVLLSLALSALTGADTEASQQNSDLGLIVLITFGYFIIAEAMFGQTAGKRLVGIRVVAEDGSPISWGKSLGRNLLRIIDSLPLLYILGLIVMSRSDRRQRIGDKAAKTIVVLSSRD